MKIQTTIVLLGALVLATGGCATTAGSGDQGAAAQAELGQSDPCRVAIEDVSRFCSEDNFSRGKCNDAKSRSRERCI